MAKCLLCDAAIEPFISFGKMPIANGFLQPKQFASEYFFELKVGVCEACGMVQLTERVDPEQLFHDNYAYFSSISTRMAAHFEQFAADVKSRYLVDEDPLVVEIGSNDGILLRHFAHAGVRHLGVEPSANVGEVARADGINTLCEFFDASVADNVVAEHGQADVVLATNVMCHIPDLHGVLEAVRILLKPGGVMIFEDPYLGDIVERTSYDQIYDEHFFYFSLSSVQQLLGRHGFELVDAEPQPVHGGSMRYTFAAQAERTVDDRVPRRLGEEQERGLARVETFEAFRAQVEQSRDALHALLAGVVEEGARVVGYGATSKSTTVTNYCGITPEMVEFVSDTTPAKQGMFTPGVHLPVRPYEEFVADYPDYALLFAWNHGDEILAKETAFREQGGKWIVYVPEVKVL
ncbi:MAG: class I SAM-dependent methyltransferase [Planctomycetota bacterium]|nr:MAG: class I SAM-dependent methyltransferase [Planctomycetota bacterium]REJ97340.1 MAG: class I SAM-dependent methyltransferase [Planctomycetota bacterium]